MIIYKITNKLTGKCYIGQTSRTLSTRWKEHCNQNYCIVDKVIKKYGKDNFSIEEIDCAETLDELNSKEIYWINYYNSKVPNGYNIADGGAGVPLVKTDEWKMKIGNSNRGNKRPDLSAYNKSKKSKPIEQLSLNGELIKVWNSSREIEKAGIGYHSAILKICNGDSRRHTAYGFIWKYHNKLEVIDNVV